MKRMYFEKNDGRPATLDDAVSLLQVPLVGGVINGHPAPPIYHLLDGKLGVYIDTERMQEAVTAMVNAGYRPVPSTPDGGTWRKPPPGGQWC